MEKLEITSEKNEKLLRKMVRIVGKHKDLCEIGENLLRFLSIAKF